LLNKVKMKYRVTYDSMDGNAVLVHKGDRMTCTFKQSVCGLYFMALEQTSTLLVNTVAENKSKYTNCDYSMAELAREVQKRIG
jgi:hypothetical protein